MTTTLGILSFSNPMKSSYMTNIALHSLRYHVQVCTFSPANIFLGKNEVFGFLFCKDTRSWIKGRFPLPSFIYDRLYYSSPSQSRSYVEKIQWLKKHRSITFLGCGLPNKWEVFQKLQLEKDVQPFFLPTKKYTLSHFKKMTLTYKEVILKPVNGSQGLGIIKVNQSLECVEVTKDGEHCVKFTSLLPFNDWIKTKKASFILQPFLSLLTVNQEPFDIRILLQKGSNGEWLDRYRAIRHGEVGKITANLATGGAIRQYEDWIKQFSQADRNELEATITRLVRDLSKELDKKFHPLFEIGVDIAIDCNLNPWILDINSKPGHKMIEMTANEQIKQQTYEAPARYCVFFKSKRVARNGVKN